MTNSRSGNKFKTNPEFFLLQEKKALDVMSSKIEGDALFLGVHLIPLLCCYTITVFSKNFS